MLTRKALRCDQSSADSPGEDARCHLRSEDSRKLRQPGLADDGKQLPSTAMIFGLIAVQEWGAKFPEAKIKKSIENTKLKRLATVEVGIGSSTLLPEQG